MRNSMAQAPLWKGKYPTTDTAHFDDLQMRADINEHMHRMPRAEAEAAAHRDYRRDQIVEAAAHHYTGMKASHAAGNEEAAKKHGLMYALAMHQLGHKDLVSPPDEVAKHSKNTPSEDIARFKAHKGDVFTMPPEEPGKEPERGRLESQVKMTKAEGSEPGPKCKACGAPYHPSTGHLHQPDFPICGACAKSFVTWLKGHTKRKWGGEDFYEAAKTSIKPGMKKAEDIVDEYPEGHRLGMKVPKGGASCEKCAYVSPDLKKCEMELFQKWNGGAELPAPADEYVCDLYVIGDKK